MSHHPYEGSPYLTGPAYIYITSADGLPPPHRAGDDLDAIARVKLFDPNGGWTWYVAGYDRDPHRLGPGQWLRAGIRQHRYG